MTKIYKCIYISKIPKTVATVDATGKVTAVALIDLYIRNY